LLRLKITKINGHVLNYLLHVDDWKKITIDGIQYKNYRGSYLYDEEKVAILVNTEWVDILEDWIKTKSEMYKYSINDPVLVSNEEITSKNMHILKRRRFSHKDVEGFVVFSDGRDVWSFEGNYEVWKYAISELDLEFLLDRGEIK
jgi:hypothetical protein